jgi:formylglycine-generating enzyme required for sulfatase activity
MQTTVNFHGREEEITIVLRQRLFDCLIEGETPVLEVVALNAEGEVFGVLSKNTGLSLGPGMFALKTYSENGGWAIQAVRGLPEYFEDLGISIESKYVKFPVYRVKNFEQHLESESTFDLQPPRPGSIFVNSIDMAFVCIPKGTFEMGFPRIGGPNEDYWGQHEVQLTSDYYLGVFPVTQAQYTKVMGKNPSWYTAENEGVETGDNIDFSNRPVDNVSWKEAVKFCQAISDLPEEKEAGRVYRLPTEAEWEYACRAGSQTAFYFGRDPELLENFAWFSDNSAERTHPVGQKIPNNWGLYDMHGNVWEWCSDWLGPYPGNFVVDPKGPLTGDSKVLRGGSMSRSALHCQSAVRSSAKPTGRFNRNGFRVALDINRFR